MKKQITAKDLNEHLKHGQTTEEFAQRCQCTTEEFISDLEKAFQGKTLKDFKKRLKDNDEAAAKKERRFAKKEKGTEKPKSAASAETAQEHEVTTPMEEAKKKPLTEKEEALEGNATPEAEEKVEAQAKATTAEKVSALLKELERKEHEIRAQICNQEALRAHFSAEKKRLRDQVVQQKQELERIRQIAEKLATEFEGTVQQIHAIDDAAASLNEKLSSEGELLAQIQAEIQDLKKTSVFVYADGQVEVEGAIDYVEPTNWFKTYQELSRDELFEDLTMKQLKLLAKVACFVADLEGEYELTFEDELLQDAFEAWRA